MMPFLLLFVGLLLIFIEFYLPGGVLGVIGGLVILASVFMFASETSSVFLVILYVFGVAILVTLLIRFALWRIVHAKPGYSIYLNKDQEGYQASSYDQSAIGKQGVVLSDLKPGGYILVDGKQHQAISLTGYIPKGVEVVVIAGQEESLIVKLSKKESV